MAVAYFTMGMARVLRVSIAFLIVFLALSSVADRGRAELGVITGTAAEWHAHELIAVANRATGPEGFRIALRETVYEGEPGAIQPGVPVTVWYRWVGEARPVADKVRVLASSPQR